MNNTEKLFHVASSLNELNSKGNVKGFSSNEKGYAKIKQLFRGCSFWVHHEKDGELIIDLMVSPTALGKKPPECEKAVRSFKEYFGPSVKYQKWIHSAGKPDNYDRHYVVVSSLSVEEILSHAKKLQELIV